MLASSIVLSEAQAAANLSVYPLKLEIASGKLADTITLGNQGTQPVTVQAELLDWQQDNGVDRLAETTAVLVSPPILTLAPGTQRSLRVGRLGRRAPERIEQAYRLLVSEVPDETTQRAGGAAQTILRLSLPLFLLPEDRHAVMLPRAQWRASRNAAEPSRLRIDNDGALHAHLLTARLLRHGEVCADKAFGAYVLPGTGRDLPWPEVDSACAAGADELRMQFDGKPATVIQSLVQVPLAPPPAAAPPAEATPRP